MNTTSISQETSKRITALRFLLIVFVVFIHNNLKADDALNYYHLDFAEPAWVTWIKVLVCDVLGGAAVPLFFLFAGYLQFSKRDDYATLLKKRAKSLLVPYIAWTLVTAALFFAAQSVPAAAPFFQNENNIVRNWDFADWLNLFWVHQSEESLKNPLVYQFWFLRDLIVMIIFFPILTFFARKVPFLAFAAMLLGFLNGIPMGFGTAIFFYMAGFFCAEYGFSPFLFASKIHYAEYAVFLLFALLLRFVFAEKISLHGLSTIASCLFFLKLSHTIVANEKLFSLASRLSPLSFFLYAIHTPFLGTSLNKISWRIIPLHGAFCLVQFIAPVALCVFIGTAIGVFLKRFLPSVYRALSGSR